MTSAAHTPEGQAPAAPEFSRPIAVERIGTSWRTVTLTADDAERAALARRFGLVELPALASEVRLRRARAGRYVEIDGRVRASVVQTCVVTLEPVPASLDEGFELLLGPIGGGDRAPGADLIVDLDEPEPLDGDTIDLGEMVAQQLSLALDPYPRAPDAPADGTAEAGPAARPESPFAVLLERPRDPEPNPEQEPKPPRKTK